MKKEIRFAIFLVATLIFVVYASAATYQYSGTDLNKFQDTDYTRSYSSSITQYTQPDFKTYYGGSLYNYWPILQNAEDCTARQDFIVQVAPFGCQPKVVRSDLLEDQKTVPVFCQLNALKINPLINVNEIDYMDVISRGGQPAGVAGVGYHPADVALGTDNNILVNSPVLDNVGYAVVLLKGGMAEKDMPSSVSGNLSAVIHYSAKNFLGTGRSEFYLPVLKEDDWKRNYVQYSFWDGKGYLRLNDMDAQKANVGIYIDSEKKFRDVTIQKGGKSESMFLPGFYCRAGLNLIYSGTVYPKDKAVLNVDGESYQLYTGEKFLDDSCQASVVEAYGSGAGRIIIQCPGKTSELSVNSRPVELEYSAKNIYGSDEIPLQANLLQKVGASLASIVPAFLKVADTKRGEISSISKEFAIGDLLNPEKESTEPGLYVAYVGKTPESMGVDGGKRFVALYKTEGSRSSVAQISKRIDKYVKGSRAADKEEFQNGLEKIVAFGGIGSKYNWMLFLRNIVLEKYYGTAKLTGSSEDYKLIEVLLEGDTNKEITVVWQDAYIPTGIVFPTKIKYFMHTYTISVNKFTGISISPGKDFDTNFNEALKAYNTVLDDYPSESIPEANELGGKQTTTDGTTTSEPPKSGEYALITAINLADETEQFDKELELLQEFVVKYPQSSYFNKFQIRMLELANLDYKNAYDIIDINGKQYRFSLESVEAPKQEDYSVKISMNGEEGSYVLDGDYIRLNDAQKDYIQIKSFTEDYVDFVYKCSDQLNENVQTSVERINLNQEKTICRDKVRIEEINLKKIAKIVVQPELKDTVSYVNFSFNIGIEKRAIQLSPEKTEEMIQNLNESIEKVEGVSNKLGNTVKVMKGACFATYGALTIKNLVSGFSGSGMARKSVMRDNGGWTEKCQQALNNKDAPGTPLSGMKGTHYSSLDDCFNQNADLIDKDVEIRTQQIKNINNEINSFEKVQGGFLQEKTVNTLDSVEKFIEKHPEELKGITVMDYKKGYVTYDELKEIVIAAETAKMSGASEVLNEMDKANAKKIIEGITGTNGIKTSEESVKTYQQKLEATTGKDIKITSYSTNKNILRGLYTGNTLTPNIKSSFGITDSTIADNAPYEVINFNAQKYLLILSPDTKTQYDISRIFGLKTDGDKAVVSQEFIKGSQTDRAKTFESIKMAFAGFTKVDASLYKHEYKNPEIRFFESGSYKGMPALVPIDTRDGWYAGTKETLPIFGGIKSYQDSGKVSSFWLCNVGENELEEFQKSDFGDDECMQFNPDTGQTMSEFPGLDTSEAKKKVDLAIKEIRSAATQYRSGVSKIKLSSGTYKVGSPAVDIPTMQCQDFMSPKECLILFNVCDPVICPSSRCDFGGQYPVPDVIQQGVVGGMFLCAPNYKEGIKVPFCLSGIKAGLDSYVSVLKGARDCLQESLTTGKNIGICDEVKSIYMCELLWREIGPITNMLVPKIVSAFSGQGERGGGEYLTVSEAWQNTQQSIDYFSQEYAVNALEAFKVRSTEEAGTAVCKSFVSLNYPNSFSSLLEPDSPTQFTAWFSEIPYSEATAPATSQYKVYFHIYAGEDQGVNYQVYLKGAPQTSYYQSTERIIIDRGYTAKGDYTDLTRDLTAPAGYKELCIMINAQENCGFKQVSTSFALNYARDSFVAQELQRTDIKTEQSCVSGSTGTSSSLASFIQPNLQEAAAEALNPSIYNRGIIRICATDNPGKTTDPTAWIEVGYCGDSRIKCWLDKDSVKNAITDSNLGAVNKTLGALEEFTKQSQAAKAGAQFNSNNVNAVLNDVDKSKNNFVSGTEGDISALTTSISKVNAAIKQAVLNSDKARLYVKKGELYGTIAKNIYLLFQEAKSAKSQAAAAKETGSGTPTPTAVKGDVNGDGVVDQNDVAVITQAIAEGSTDSKFDINGDGKVDALDLQLVSNAVSSQLSPTTPEITQVSFNSLSELIIGLRDGGVVSNGRSTLKCRCGTNDNCNNYASWIIKYSNDNKIDPLLTLALMIQESSCVKDADSGSSYGLMQINAKAHCGEEGLPTCNEDKTDCKDCIKVLKTNPEKNIEVGIKILKANFNEFGSKQTTFKGCEKTVPYTGMDAALRAYNGWGCGKNPLTEKPYVEQDFFVDDVNTIYENLKKAYSGVSADEKQQTQITPQEAKQIKTDLQGEEVRTWGKMDEAAFAACFISNPDFGPKEEVLTSVTSRSAAATGQSIYNQLKGFGEVTVEAGSKVTGLETWGTGIIKHFPEKGVYNIVVNSKGLPIGQVIGNNKLISLSDDIFEKLGVPIIDRLPATSKYLKGVIDPAAKISFKSGGAVIESTVGEGALVYSKNFGLKFVKSGTKIFKTVSRISDYFLLYSFFCTGLEVDKEVVELRYEVLDAQLSQSSTEEKLGELIINVEEKMDKIKEKYQNIEPLLDSMSSEDTSFLDDCYYSGTSAIEPSQLKALWNSFDNNYNNLKKKYVQDLYNKQKETSGFLFWSTEKKITDDEYQDILNDYNTFSASLNIFQEGVDDLMDKIIYCLNTG